MRHVWDCINFQCQVPQKILLLLEGSKCQGICWLHAWYVEQCYKEISARSQTVKHKPDQNKTVHMKSVSNSEVTLKKIHYSPLVVRFDDPKRCLSWEHKKYSTSGSHIVNKSNLLSPLQIQGGITQSSLLICKTYMIQPQERTELLPPHH